MLVVSKLSASIQGTNILNELNITVKKSEIHAIIGPNGSGKSTLANVITGKPDYEVSGSITLDGQPVHEMSISERAKAGIFMSFQAPPSIPGVSNFALVKEVMSSDPTFAIVDNLRKYKEDINMLKLPTGWEKRGINDGASGGERKKNELLQFLQFNSKIAILDEIDSGLDVDALKVIVNAIKEHKEKCGWIIISHNPSVLKEINPTHVHILEDGNIINTGRIELIDKIEEYGFRKE